MHQTFIIAEVGVNHNGDLVKANQLIDTALAVGADAVKFQTAIPELVVTKSAQKSKYQQMTSGANESQLDMIRKIHFPLEVYASLKESCDQKGITFFSSAFDMLSLAYLEELGQSYHKIPSGEITNLPYLREIGHFKKPVFLSTGMATMEEIGAAINVLEQAGLKRSNITVFHCNTEYPTPMLDVNLRAMQAIASAFDVAVGYSDHTEGIEVAVAAVALGACAIEKHLTLSHDLLGPDHKASLEPAQFRKMVAAIRNTEQALGAAIKQPSQSELHNKSIVRRSIVAAVAIKAGEEFTVKNVIAKRPGTGISPMLWDDIVGRIALRDFKADEMIEL